MHVLWFMVNSATCIYVVNITKTQQYTLCTCNKNPYTIHKHLVLYEVPGKTNEIRYVQVD